MNSALLLKRIDVLTKNNRIMGIVIVLMLVWNVMNTIQMHQARNHEKVVMVPIGSRGSTDLWIGDGTASEAYIKAVARKVVAAFGTYTVATYRDQLEELIPLFSPDVFGDAQGTLNGYAEEAEKYPSVSFVAHIEGENPIKRQGDLIQVHALKQRLINGKTTETTSTFYCIQFRIDESHLWLTRVKEREGTGSDLCFLAEAQAQQEKK